VLILMNTYPLIISENLVFRSKQTSMSGSVSLVEAALSDLGELTEENVAQALGSVEETGVSRILVTDTAGRVLYDTREEGGALGLYAFYTEIAQALSGNDAFYIKYDSTAFLSRGASPVVHRDRIIGAVYAYEYDTEQALLLKNLQSNLLRISLIVAAATILLSTILSHALTGQISELLEAIKRVREGAYSHRAVVESNDEIGQIASEFNSLTDRLQVTEEARRRFVSDASHELKTPLAGIQLMADSILQNDMDAATVREFAGDISEESQRLTRITEDLLALTRLDNGVADKAEILRVGPVVEKAVHALSVVAREKEITLSCEIIQDAWVLAAEDEVRQIAYNLTENAIKYNTAMGFVHVALTSDEKSAILTVEDNGIGIPDADMAHIFERFYRVDKNRSRAIGGTGLGLSIVSDMIRRRDGTITVAHRSDGSGTVFTVCLPLTEGGEAP
jgi:signal transduction histidine kinase